jgi:peptidoglycan/LPS O-acetylase OafA/YrhL
LSCFDAIAVGVLTAILARGLHPSKTVAVCLRILGTVMLVGASLIKTQDTMIFGPTIIAMGTSALLFTARDKEQERPIILRTFLSFGRCSYELYLFHILVLAAMRDIAGPGLVTSQWRPFWLIAFLLLSITVAALLSRYFSEPMNRRLRHQLLKPIVCESNLRG